MRTRHWKMTLNIVVVLAVCASLSWAQQPAVTFSSVYPENTGDPGTGFYYGWMFRVTQDTYITDLGLYDVGADGLLGTWNVGLWKYVVNTTCPHGWEIVPLASTTMGPISGGPAEGDCHFASLSEPVLVQPVPLADRTGPYDGIYFVGFYLQEGLPREYLLLPGGTISRAPDSAIEAGFPVQAYGTIPGSGPWDRPTGIGNDCGVNFKYTLEPPGPTTVQVDIDIKPGSYPNSLNINGNGVIPVAILGSATFDVTLIDPVTLLFNGSALRVRGQNPGWHIEDVSGDFSTSEAGAPDGYPDLVCQFLDDPAQWVEGATTGEVTGNLLEDGTAIVGTDSVNIVRLTP